METNEVTGQIIDAAIKVHTALGPGLLESAYEVCLAHELRQRDMRVQTQVVLPIQYQELNLDAGYRIDLLVQDIVIVELKAVERMLPLYDAQILSYLRLRRLEVGLLINFNVVKLKEGLKRIVNNYSGQPPRSSATSAVTPPLALSQKDFE
jgi:GxxExxY protein